MRFLFLIALVFALGLTVFAQKVEVKTAFSGRVSDENGAVIEKIKVVATNKEGKKFETVTNEDGVYLLEIPKGEYVIEFLSDAGFLGVKVEGYKVAGAKMTFDVVMEVDMESPFAIISEFICKPNKEKKDAVDCEYVSRKGNGTGKPKNVKIQPLKKKSKD